MGRMPRNHRFLLCALPLALTACGAGSAGNASGAGTATPSTSASPVAPVTIERSGGVAGFHDRVVVAADGTVTATTRGGATTCSVDPAFVAALQVLALAASTSATTSYPVGTPDAMTVVLTTANGSVTLDPGALPATAPQVGQLLDDVGRAAADRSLCH
jgi:hypothetical protein